MSDILVEMDKFIASNKDVLSVLPINTKKNKSKYYDKVCEFEETAVKIKKVIWNEIESRYQKIIDLEENPQIANIVKDIETVENIDLFNELNTPYEKLGFDKINHSLSCFFEGDLGLLNDNIKMFLDIMKNFGIVITQDDFYYSQFTSDYMKVFFDEYENGDIHSEKLKKCFEQIYWKCPDIVIHIELNMRYLYYVNSKKVEKELSNRNAKVLNIMQLDKNGLVRRFFELNKDLIKLKRRDAKYILNKFITGEWKIKDFGDKEMSVLYDKLSTKDYYAASEDEREEIDKNFGKLLNTLEEYKIYVRYKYIIDHLKEKYKEKESFKGAYERKNKEIRKKEQQLLKESKKHKRIIKHIKSPIFIFVKKKLERKVYEFPVASNSQIKELKKMYDDLDEELVNTRILDYVDDNCSIKYMFKIVVSFYTYAYKLIKEHCQDDVGETLEELRVLIDFINQPYKVMLNNMKLAEEPEIASIISNRYKILNIKLEKEDLEADSIDAYAENIEKIVNYHNIRRSGLDIEDIAFVEKVKPMIEKMNKQK